MNVNVGQHEIEEGHVLVTVYVGDDPIANIRLIRNGFDLEIELSEATEDDCLSIGNALPEYFLGRNDA